MNARLERKLRLLRGIVVGSVIGAVAYVVARGHTSAAAIEAAILYALLISVAIGGIALFILQGPMREWLGSLSFTVNLIVLSEIYAAIFVPILFFQLGDMIAGVPFDPTHKTFWTDIAYSVGFWSW